ncbi:MAG: hypothetical protein Q8K98_05905 [Bacteroidota bacterium]|nr:hypothetical protein [Bacteroidota bacterium]
MKKIILLILLLFLISDSILLAQERGDRTFRKSGTLNGNRVKTVFGNWGVIAQPDGIGPRGAWKYDDNGYVGDVSPLVAVEVPVKKKRRDGTIIDTTFTSVVICPVTRPGGGDGPPGGGAFWGFEPIPGYANPNKNELGKSVAVNNIRDTWPPYWPDQPTWIDAQGNAQWNGYFGRGVMNSDQETYFKMDDNADEEFNATDWKVFSADSSSFIFVPDSADLTRKGLGLEVKVRAMQWNNFLAQDGIFWLYEITNKSKVDYPKVAFGMIVGTYVGIDGTEWNDDVSFFDVKEDLTYSWDYNFSIDPSANPKWQPTPTDVGFVGYAFLESPSNSYDGIDNDGDGRSGSGDFFTELDFLPRVAALSPGNNPNFPANKLVLIDKKTFARTVVDVPTSRTDFVSQGKTYSVAPGDSLKEIINNGFDDDLDGMIDENLEVHYKQIRRKADGTILFEKLNPLKYKNYFTGLGLSNILIDEARDDGIDNDGDWDITTDDVGADGVAGTGDAGEGNGRPDAGEPRFDATDIDESDMIGLTSFEYFVPAGNISMANDANLWQRMAPGFFEVPTNFVNNMAIRGEDGDFIYGSGYFPLPAGKTERFSLALFFGEAPARHQLDTASLYSNLRTMKQIYSNNYNFAKPPEKPNLTVVAGDGKVTLYWDRTSEEKTFDSDLKVNDFEGYKIYRSTEPNFNDIRVISDGQGNPLFDRPLAQFDLKNGISGFFPNDFGKGVKYFLGSDVGIQHSFVDSTVQNGKIYYYAVVAYDRGDVEKNLPPSENTKFIARDATGKITLDINTAFVIPQKPSIGYVPPPSGIQLTKTKGQSEGTVYYNVIDATKIKDGNKYTLKFFDSSMDSVDNNNNWRNHIKNTAGNIIAWRDDVGADGDSMQIDIDGTQGNGKPDVGEPNIDHRDNEEMIPITSYYQVVNNTNPSAPITVINKSPYMHRTPYLPEVKDSDIFDGVTLDFRNKWEIKYDSSQSGWLDKSIANVLTYDIRLYDKTNPRNIKGVATPFDYEIVFFDTYEQWSTSLSTLTGTSFPAKKTNFKIFNITDPQNKKEIKYGFKEPYYPGQINDTLSNNDYIVILDSLSKETITWMISFYGKDSIFHRPTAGDRFIIRIQKPFSQIDEFEFSVTGAKINVQKAKSEIKKVKVVPNPYVSATTQEQPLPTGVTGRGERKITFTNVPVNSKIEIYTSRGEHIRTLYHSGNMFEGEVTWELRTKENLDVAFGVYFYVVDAPEVGVQYGKIAVIK